MRSARLCTLAFALLALPFALGACVSGVNGSVDVAAGSSTSDASTVNGSVNIGANAKAIITGDLTQVDLPKNQKSGLAKASRILKNIDGIGYIELDEEDVVRHRLVKAIIKAYETEKVKEDEHESLQEQVRKEYRARH